MAYDYTVLAGTQGAYNHQKMDRLIELAERWPLPTVFFCEGGGGRPGDTEGGGSFVRGFELWGRMSGVAPMVGVTSGRCFAGNASVLGCCDVIIATKDSNIGMGGPAMIEGGGLGVFRPEEIGPVSVQEPNGVIDILAEDEADAVALAKQYLSYFQGPLTDWTCADQRLLRRVIPENRLRVYDIRELIGILADDGSVLEIRPKFGQTMITAFDPHRGPADGRDRQQSEVPRRRDRLATAPTRPRASCRSARPSTCRSLSLSDTPGMMVGPEIEKTALVRHCSRLFIIGANLTVPLLSVVLRKSYGLGAHGDDRRQLPGVGVRGRLADRRVRRHGAGGLGQARLPQRAGRHRRSRPSAAPASTRWSPSAYEGGKALNQRHHLSASTT